MEEMDYPYEFIDREFIEERRWYSIWSGVFEFEGKYYQTIYLSPATEMQDEDPWNYDEEIVATEVVRLPVVKYTWVEVNN